MKYIALLTVLIVVIISLLICHRIYFIEPKFNENSIFLYYLGNDFPEYELIIDNEIIGKGKFDTKGYAKFYEFTKTSGKSIIVKINGNIVGRGGTTSIENFHLIIVTNGSSLIFDEF